jgi:hypothetical protein
VRRHGRQLSRAGVWLAVTGLVVLGARVLAYALAPRPGLIGSRLEQQTGGPRLIVVALIAMALAAALSTAVVWVVAVGVGERARLEPLAVVPAPIPILRIAARGAGLWFASALAFSALESYLHWRAGLGWHGPTCLVGPVHRNAIPLLAALCLIASALTAAAAHLIAWMRRVVTAILGSARPRLRSSRPAPRLALTLLPPRAAGCGGRLGARAPPARVSVLVRRPVPSSHY